MILCACDRHTYRHTHHVCANLSMFITLYCLFKLLVPLAGQCWDVPNLYVADASTFPTPSGANPMLTTLATSHMIAQGIKTKLAKPPPKSRL